MDNPGFGKSNCESAASAGSHSGQEEELWLIPKPGSKLLLPHLKTVEPLTSSSISLSQLQPSTTTKGEEGDEQDYAAAAAAKVADAAAAECEDKADNDDSNSSENEVVSSSSPEHQETSSSKKVLTKVVTYFSFANLGASLQQLFSNIF